MIIQTGNTKAFQINPCKSKNIVFSLFVFLLSRSTSSTSLQWFSVFVAINLHFSEFEDINLTAKIHNWYSSWLLTRSKVSTWQKDFFTMTNHFLQGQSTGAKIVVNCHYILKGNYISLLLSLIQSRQHEAVGINHKNGSQLCERLASIVPFCRLFFQPCAGERLLVLLKQVGIIKS